MIKRIIATTALALFMLPFGVQAASARPLPAECLWYQTFAERNLTDCVL